MAKANEPQQQQQPGKPTFDERALAEKLFVAIWQPKSSTTTEHLAHLCIEAARAYGEVLKKSY